MLRFLPLPAAVFAAVASAVSKAQRTRVGSRLGMHTKSKTRAAFKRARIARKAQRLGVRGLQ